MGTQCVQELFFWIWSEGRNGIEGFEWGTFLSFFKIILSFLLIWKVSFILIWKVMLYIAKNDFIHRLSTFQVHQIETTFP